MPHTLKTDNSSAPPTSSPCPSEAPELFPAILSDPLGLVAGRTLTLGPLGKTEAQMFPGSHYRYRKWPELRVESGLGSVCHSPPKLSHTCSRHLFSGASTPVFSPEEPAKTFSTLYSLLRNKNTSRWQTVENSRQNIPLEVRNIISWWDGERLRRDAGSHRTEGYVNQPSHPKAIEGEMW